MLVKQEKALSNITQPIIKTLYAWKTVAFYNTWKQSLFRYPIPLDRQLWDFQTQWTKEKACTISWWRKRNWESVTRKHNESARQQQSLSAYSKIHHWTRLGVQWFTVGSLAYLLEIHTWLVFPVVRRSGLLTWIGCWAVLCCVQWLNHVWSCNSMDCSPHWRFPGKKAGVGCHFLLQEIFPTQGANPHLLYLLHWRHCNSLPTERLGNTRMSTKGTFW